MSQIFSADAQVLSASVVVTQNVETTILTFNPLKVPFQNGKIVLDGNLVLDTGATTTAYTVRCRRNANAENVLLNTGGQAINVAAASRVNLGFAATDFVPDGRDCVYTVTVQQTGATAAGAAQPGTGGIAMVLSG